MKYRYKLPLAFGAAMFLLVAASLFDIFSLNRALNTYGTQVQAKVQSERAVNAMLLAFKVQVQEWKDTLLRGKDPKRLEKHWGAFENQERAVDDLVRTLQATLPDGESRALVDRFGSAHVAMGEGYRRGLEAFKGAIFDAAAGDAAVAGVDLSGDILNDHGVDPDLLELEPTESTLMVDSEAAVQALSNMKARGIRLAVDDFGTGYSSLSYVKRFPLDALKIDRTSIRDVATDPDGATIMLAIISLARSLKLKVVAEGVETATQMDFLRARGCDELQGFLFSRPVPVEQMTQLLRDRRSLAVAASVRTLAPPWGTPCPRPAAAPVAY